MNQIFDTVYCLNQDTRPDRWQQAEEEFRRVGVKVQRFASIEATPPFKSFCLSQYAMIKKYVDDDGGVLLTLEDDVIFTGSLDHVKYAFAELPDNWDVLYLGANDRGITPVKFSKHLCRIRTAWTTHAVAYSRKMARYIVENYPVDLAPMYDDWLSNKLPNLQAFIVNPPVARQRPVFSDLWGVHADYTGCFDDVEKRMSQ